MRTKNRNGSSIPVFVCSQAPSTQIFSDPPRREQSQNRSTSTDCGRGMVAGAVSKTRSRMIDRAEASAKHNVQTIQIRSAGNISLQSRRCKSAFSFGIQETLSFGADKRKRVLTLLPSPQSGCALSNLCVCCFKRKTVFDTLKGALPIAMRPFDQSTSLATVSGGASSCSG